MTKQYYFTQEIIHFCELFGNPFFFLKDVDGHIYGVPAMAIKGHSVDGKTGEVTEFVQRYEPDLTR